MTDTPEPAPDVAPKPARASWFSEARVGLAGLVVGLIALVIAVAPYATGGDFDARVRSYLLANPEVLQEVSDALNAKADVARQAADRDLAGQITARAAANPALLAADPRDPSFGPANAKVTVVEFFDFRCPGCKATAPEVLALMQAHPDVRFVFKDWPILDRGSDGMSHLSARAAQAAHRQGKYLPVFRDLMAEPDLTPDTIARILNDNGVSLPQAEAAMASGEIASHLADVQTTATTLGLQGTPTFMINGKASATIQPADIDAAIRAAKAS
jgi:protein-disulfide isomerase